MNKNRTESKYIFQIDWFSPFISSWEKFLSPFKEKSNLNFLEIGSFEGKSTIWLLENILTHPTDRLTCIDTFMGSAEHSEKDYQVNISLIEEHFLHNIEVSGAKEKVTILKGFSREILPKLIHKSFDFIYIDGSHKASDVLEDTILSFLLLKKNGVLIFDDYKWIDVENILERPKLAIDAFLQIYEGQYQLLFKDYQVIVKSLV